MATMLRKSPPVCLGISLIKLLLGRLRLSRQFVGEIVKMKDDQEFNIFRHITSIPTKSSPAKRTEKSTVFIVSFKFARLSHKANKIASIMPMLLITGYPGFHVKMYGVNYENGYWQGMYQWESRQALEAYKKSFVFGMMNKRAIFSTLQSLEIDNNSLADFINKYKV
jgi:hypothetical protein